MPVKQSHYEELLASYSNQSAAIALLKQYRPYLEMLPSLRRAAESVVVLPLPVARIKLSVAQIGPGQTATPGELTRLPCDIALLMCDPDWKVKTGVEIFIFIHRPHEDFSDLLSRWRQTQVWLDRGYEWTMPPHYKHILSEEAEDKRPLFVIFPETPERIKRGLQGACLPFVTQNLSLSTEEEFPEETISEDVAADDYR